MVQWEAISSIDPNNQETLDKLYFLYGQLDMKAKLASVISRMKALGMDVD